MNNMEDEEKMLVPRQAPYKLASEYLNSKAASREMIKLFDCGDYIRDGTVINSNYFLKKKLSRTNKLLEKKRSLANRRRHDLDEQWENLQKRETDLRQMFVKFNQFVTENNDKRIRACQRISELKKLLETREKQIEKTLDECKELEKLKEAMSEKIVRYRLYEVFLMSVVEMFSEDFTNVHDILDRYELIKRTSQDLAEHLSADLYGLETAKRELAKTVARYLIVISGLRTKMASLEQRFEATKRETAKWEELYERIRAKATEQLLDVASVKDSCWRIYKEICERKGVEPAFKDDYGKQLDIIKKTLRDYQNINGLARKMEEEKLYASQVPCVSKATD